jgi:IS5 family transposase
VDHLLMRCNTGSGVRVDAAYRSAEMEVKLRDRKLKSHIHRKGKRRKPLTDQAKGSNRTKSSVRVRAEAKIGMKSLADNMRHLSVQRILCGCNRIWRFTTATLTRWSSH